MLIFKPVIMNAERKKRKPKFKEVFDLPKGAKDEDGKKKKRRKKRKKKIKNKTKKNYNNII